MAFPNHTIFTAVAVAAFGMLVAASGAALAPGFAPAVIACLPDGSPAGEGIGKALPREPAAAVRPDPARDALVRYLSRRYQIAAESTEKIVGTAYRAAQEVGLDPLLVLAVIAVESRFNPVAESVMGAKGLMQIIPRFHLDKLEAHGGEDAVLDPERNILVGSQILQEYVRRTGTLEAGLQFYNGALRDPRAAYAQRVLAERSRLMGVTAEKGT